MGIARLKELAESYNVGRATFSSCTRRHPKALTADSKQPCLLRLRYFLVE